MLERLRDLLRYPDAVRTLVIRDLKVRYSNSVLGFFWSLLSPLLMMAVFTLIFAFLVPGSIDKYPVYILAGLLPWNFFSGATMGAVGSIVANGHLISRVYFPREILPLSIVLSNLVNFLLALGVLFALALLYQVPLGGSLLFLPFVILIQTLFSMGLGLFLSALNVLFRDTQQIMEVLLLAWFFLTPILYPLERLPGAALQQAWLAVNPMASLVVGYRTILYAGGMPDWRALGVTTLESAALLALGYWFFSKSSPNFVEEL